MNPMHVLLGGLLVLLFHVFNVLVLKPRSLRAKLERQGIHGPTPHFYYGNIPEMKMLFKQQAHSTKDNKDMDVSMSHNWPSTLFPHFEKWRNQYGPTFLFSTGNAQWLVVTDIEMVKEVTLYTSLNLGKPTHVSRELRPLLGQEGILSANGSIWAHERKIIAPALYLGKVKGMVDLIVDSTNTILRSWESRMKGEGVFSEITIDDDLRSLSANIIARACFGINYIEGKEIFSKLRDLQELLSTIYAGIPGFRYLPTKKNKEIWRLEKEVNLMILKMAKEHQQDAQEQEQDLLQLIIDGAKDCAGGDGLFSNSRRDRFIIANCKNIFFAGHETTATAASWCLMLLAVHQDWQDRVRAEVLEVCGNNAPDPFMLKNLKTLNMVIQETMRLYPSAAAVTREALQDIHLKGILIPKGMNIQIPVPVLMQDPELWGPDAHKFNPERFSNGVLSAGDFPQAYMPFGTGARVCPGLHLAMTELKVILSLILTKFRFHLSPSYHHSPIIRLVLVPGQGVVLKMARI